MTVMNICKFSSLIAVVTGFYKSIEEQLRDKFNWREVFIEKLNIPRVSTDPKCLLLLAHSSDKKTAIYGVHQLTKLHFPDWLLLPLLQQCDSSVLSALILLHSPTANLIRTPPPRNIIPEDVTTCKEMSHPDLLGLLWSCWHCTQYSSDVKIKSLILKTLANLAAFNLSIGDALIRAGWSKILNECKKDRKRLQLQLLATKTLENLARRFPDSPTYEDGIYLLKGSCWDRNLLLSRSENFAAKLRKAGVGDRPIIWITHSMGGLLVKELLRSIDKEQCSETQSGTKSILSNTVGCVFYATPHLGSSLATTSQSRILRLFLLPSTEINLLQEKKHCSLRFAIPGGIEFGLFEYFAKATNRLLIVLGNAAQSFAIYGVQSFAGF
ncbi:protein SERAC1 [Trichinella spiralis]|uniref:protein SERAC1 n=1 Tax=Trichinella spiralis TaxID=6334 RepID=UPI0001EFCD4D|nr:protein SERAC1 [Trichinella spiralis]